ncbi:MAG TPA: MFS transporter [Gaiellaceae bacterium]|nr:MFS transporter [Gaiellaceae bacterium]
MFAAVSGRTFASLGRYRNFRLYFAGQAISFTGTWMQQIAASWLVLTLTHSAVAVGALALVQLLPVTVLGLFVGTILDRFDVRRTAILCESISLVLAAILAALTLGGVVTVAEVFALAGLQGIVNAIDAPARHSLVFQMVGRKDLPNAVALTSSLGTTARILGPALGGLVVAFAGSGVCFALNAVSFLAILVCLLSLDTAAMLKPVRDRGATVIGGAADGMRFVAGSRRAGAAFAVVFVLATFAFNFNVLLPLLAARTLDSGAATFGLLAAIFGAGALCGALINATSGKASIRRLLIGATGFGLFELILAPQHSLLPVCVLLLATGVCYTLWGTNALTVMQLEAPEHLRGRAVAMYFFAFLGGAPLGGLLAGWLVSVGGTPLAFAVGGATSVTMAMLAVLYLGRAQVPAGQRPSIAATASAMLRSAIPR